MYDVRGMMYDVRETFFLSLRNFYIIRSYLLRHTSYILHHFLSSQGIGKILLSLNVDKITMVEVAETSSISLIFSNINF